MEYAAHIRENGDVQTVAEHCRNTAEYCSKYAADVGMKNTGMLAGLLHDMGKLCSDFNGYIRGENDISRG